MFKIFICSYEFNIQIQLIGIGDFSGILRLLFVGSSIISWLFIFCELGNKLTQRYDEFGVSIYSIAWYKLPLRLQQCIPMTILIAQNSIYLRGFGSAHCTREVFKRVCTFGSVDL